jgi:hypothetical protein
MGRPPFVALFGRLPQDATSLIELSCRYRSTNEGLLPQTDTAGNSFSCSMGKEDRGPHHASLLAGTVLRLSREITNRRWQVEFIFSKRTCQLRCRRGDSNSHGFPHHPLKQPYPLIIHCLLPFRYRSPYPTAQQPFQSDRTHALS